MAVKSDIFAPVGVVLAAIVTLFLAEAAATSASAAGVPSTVHIERGDNIVILSRDPAKIPAPAAGPSVLLLGNSHTYALPGLQRGESLRPDPGKTLLDEMARRLQSRLQSGRPPTFLRLSEPNFLPVEMLLRIGHLLHAGHRPSVVVIGLTWRNIARDSEVRHDVRMVARNAEFADSFPEALRSIGADESLVSYVESIARQARSELEQERLRSHADRVDLALTTTLGEHVSLVGQSSDLRARFYREFAYRLHALVSRHEPARTNEAMASDLQLNEQSIVAMVRLLKRHGAKVVCYQAPERTDIPPIVGTALQEPTLKRIASELERNGFPLLDARHVVPNENWGWERDTPDRSHFTEPGHARLAAFLVEEAASRGAWRQLAGVR